MQLNRRDGLKGAAVATAGSLTMLTGAGTASAPAPAAIAARRRAASSMSHIPSEPRK